MWHYSLIMYSLTNKNNYKFGCLQNIKVREDSIAPVRTIGYCHTPVAWPRRNWTSCAQRSPAAAPEPPREFTGVRPAHATDGLVK